MSTTLRPFMVVRVTTIRADRFTGATFVHGRSPRLGDIGTVLEKYEKPEVAYDVECSDPATGATLWLAVMFPDELEACPDEPAVPSGGTRLE